MCSSVTRSSEARVVLRAASRKRPGALTLRTGSSWKCSMLMSRKFSKTSAEEGGVALEVEVVVVPEGLASEELPDVAGVEEVLGVAGEPVRGGGGGGMTEGGAEGLDGWQADFVEPAQGIHVFVWVDTFSHEGGQACVDLVQWEESAVHAAEGVELAWVGVSEGLNGLLEGASEEGEGVLESNGDAGRLPSGSAGEVGSPGQGFEALGVLCEDGESSVERLVLADGTVLGKFFGAASKQDMTVEAGEVVIEDGDLEVPFEVVVEVALGVGGSEELSVLVVVVPALSLADPGRAACRGSTCELSGRPGSERGAEHGLESVELCVALPSDGLDLCEDMSHHEVVFVHADRAEGEVTLPYAPCTIQGGKKNVHHSTRGSA